MAGTAGGLRLVAPDGADTRPTTDRVREAVFNALGSLGLSEPAHVLDGFAGSGALGIESLSRGALAATFVERDPDARAAIATNLEFTGLGAAARIVAADLASHLARTADRYDLVMLDPPYAFERWDDVLTALEPRLDPEAIVVLEAPRPVVSGWGEIIREKRYGGTVVQFARPPHVPPPTSPSSGAPA